MLWWPLSWWHVCRPKCFRRQRTSLWGQVNHRIKLAELFWDHGSFFSFSNCINSYFQISAIHSGSPKTKVGNLTRLKVAYRALAWCLKKESQYSVHVSFYYLELMFLNDLFILLMIYLSCFWMTLVGTQLDLKIHCIAAMDGFTMVTPITILLFLTLCMAWWKSMGIDS
jgi:hypothetical protein